MRRREWLRMGLASAGAGFGCKRRRPGKIVVATSPHVSMSGLYLAHESGYFEQAGLEVEFQRIPMGTEALPLLAGGKLDASFFALTPSLINAIAKGAKVRIVAGREIAVSCNETCTLYLSRKAFPGGSAELSRLKGKRVAVSGATLTHFCLDKFLEPAGLSSKDLDIRSMRPSDATVAMTAGRLDAIITGRMDRDVKSFSEATFRVRTLAQALPDYQYSFIVFGKSLLAGDVSVGARFLASYLRGAREFAGGRTPQFLYDYAKTNNLDPHTVINACRETTTLDGSVDLRSLDIFVDWAAGMKFSEKRVPAAEMVDTRFLEEARKL